MDSRQKIKKRENLPLAVVPVPLLPVRQEGPQLVLSCRACLCLPPPLSEAWKLPNEQIHLPKKKNEVKMSDDMLKKNVHI